METAALCFPSGMLQSISSASSTEDARMEHPVSGLGMKRNKSVFSSLCQDSRSQSSMSTSCSSATDDSNEEDIQMLFSQAIKMHADPSQSGIPNFEDSALRKKMEPFLRNSRAVRQKRFNRQNIDVHASIASSVGVPYTTLRREKAFLFDTGTHPLHTVIAEAMGVEDLAKIHTAHDRKVSSLIARISQGEERTTVKESYDSFVNSFCIPLLHEMAISKRVFRGSSTASGCITYRYQAFPTISVNLPGSTERVLPPTCDLATGHSIGCLKFHVPLTPSFGTNALYVESHPGREDWHPLLARSSGLGFIFDGSRCIHFDLENTTNATRVSLEFRVLFYRSTSEPNALPLEDGVLTPPDVLDDHLSNTNPGYYDESVMDLSRLTNDLDLVVKKKKN